MESIKETVLEIVFAVLPITVLLNFPTQNQT